MGGEYSITTGGDYWITRDTQREFALVGAPYHWNLDQAVMEFSPQGRRVLAELCLVGTTSESEASFLWGWANASLPTQCVDGLATVRQFGLEHDLPLLVTAEIPGGRAEALECAAIAGRVLDAAGVFVESTGDVTLFFALRNFREQRAG
jgi:hypothetical protein